MIATKNAVEIRSMRAAGAIVGDVLRLMREMAEPGVRLRTLAKEAERHIRSAGATPTFKGYQGFPSAICLSVNEEAVHGLPSWRKLRAGDILSVDVGATLDGWVGDSAITVAVGVCSEQAQGVIAAARVGASIGDLGAAVEAIVRPRGYDILREYCGHGIGRSLHEDPQVPNFGETGTGPIIASGWCLAIEPIVTTGSARVVTLPDGWTVVTRDGGLAAHAELAIAITAAGVEILSLTSAGELP
jgi:methionyl aminopeptidase